jgi:hypothetical protein
MIACENGEVIFQSALNRILNRQPERLGRCSAGDHALNESAVLAEALRQEYQNK